MDDPTTLPPNRLREIASQDRPQERLDRLGPTALSDAEILAVVLRFGTTGNDVLSLASRLLAEAGSLTRLVTWGEPEYRRVKGIGRVKAFQLLAVMELARRAFAVQSAEAPRLNRTDLIVAHFEPIVRGLEVEKFWVLCLNRKNRLLRRVEVTSGTATSALAHPREVFREAVRRAATAIVCVHNHPSGDPSPSAADIHATRQLADAARALDIELLDHVIMGRSAADPCGLGYYSFRSSGLL